VLISAGVALVSVAVSTWAARSTARVQAEWEERRRQASKEELVEQVMSRYREPLLRAAFDLQSRLYNIVKQDFLGTFARRGTPAEQAYARDNTLFVLAEYLGWVEILRRGVQFLDLGEVERNRQLAERLEAISQILADSRSLTDPCFRVFRGQQRAIGELMIDRDTAGEHGGQCLGYAGFCARLVEDSGFAGWFKQLGKGVDQLASDLAPGRERLAGLQRALMDLIDFLDDPPRRFGAAQRARL
jgi:hypothetical protein